jgi:hypothetical protein
MEKLEGIIYKAFDNFVVFRGYAPIEMLAKVSRRPEEYQRFPDDEHKRNIVHFLKNGEFKYFPELVLAYRGDNLKEFIRSLQGKDDVDFNASEYVRGLRVLKERVPYSGYRARHAQLEIDDKKLLRVDGNHRLEPFSESVEWWKDFIEDEEPEAYSDDELQQWITKRVDDFKSDIGKMIVPFSVVISNNDIADKFEASIFNNINFKQLPLKQEKNIQNIYKFLKDSEELGAAHELTMDLISLVENGHFRGLPFMDIHHREQKEGKWEQNVQEHDEIYRTICLKLVELLIVKQQETVKKIEEINKKIEGNKDELSKLETDKKELERKHGVKTGEGGKLQIKEKISNNVRIQDSLKKNIKNLKNRVDILECFKRGATDLATIEISIQSLRTMYAKFGNNVGNISLFIALVYYHMYDNKMFEDFVNWVMRNGINNIPVNDILPSHKAYSLILLFERVYESSRKKIFISMQFGDPQSEMIYEKIVQTIVKYNTEHNADIEISPIRIDREVSDNLFEIPEAIKDAIGSSSLIIADLSSRNINVYHEIGMAMGAAQAKGIPPSIILLYKTNTQFRDAEEVDEDHFVGFNLRGASQIRFTTYDELTSQLTKKLEKCFEP